MPRIRSTTTPAKLTATFVGQSDYNMGKGKILALGTSIANSTGASDTAHGYPARIKANLDTLLVNGPNMTVVAAGVNGDNTGAMAARLAALLATHRPTYVTIEASVNDSRIDVLMDAATSENNMRRMIGMCRVAGAIPLLITNAPWDAKWLYNTGNNSYDFTSPPKAVAVNTIAKNLATELGVPLVDMFTVIRNKAGVWSDGLHPNDAGHDIWGKAIAQKIAQLAVTNAQTDKARDTFDRADSTTALGTASDGGTWTVTGSWGISGNSAYSPNNTNGGVAVRSVGVSDQYVSAVVGGRVGNTGVKAPIGLIARYVDANNYYLLDFNDAAPALYRRVNGSYTNLVSLGSEWAGVSIGDEVGLSVIGSHVAVWKNGYSLNGQTDTNITTGTSAGMWNSSGSGANIVTSVWQSFAVTV